MNTDKRASAGKREVERSNGMLLLLGFSCWRWCDVISAFGIGGVKLREAQNREKAGYKQGSVFFFFFVVVRRGKAGDLGLYVTFRVLEIEENL